MFDTVILLSGDAELSVLPHLLIGHNPYLKVIKAKTAFDLLALNSELLARARLIAFVTGEIVPVSILNRLGYGAINFHPGPPSYPGWAPAHFALYNREREFGVTAHVMIEQVDAGPIIDTTLFPIPADISVLGLEGLGYAHLAHLFWRMAGSLATEPALPPSKLAKVWAPAKLTAPLAVNVAPVGKPLAEVVVTLNAAPGATVIALEFTSEATLSVPALTVVLPL